MERTSIMSGQATMVTWLYLAVFLLTLTTSARVRLLSSIACALYSHIFGKHVKDCKVHCKSR